MAGAATGHHLDATGRYVVLLDECVHHRLCPFLTQLLVVGRRTGFLIGNEARGLTEETASMADAYVRIPMEGQVESLNAAVAASILMYEVSRQRRKTAVRKM